MSEQRGYGYCPTCGATGDGECATPTGRDHPARRHYALGYQDGLNAGRHLAATEDQQ